MAKPRYTHQQELHLWKRGLQQSDQRHRDYQRDAEKADVAIENAQERAEAILEKAQGEAQRAASERSKLWAAEEKKLLTRPRVVRRGATVGNKDDIWVSHHLATVPTPLARKIGLPEGASPLIRLRPGGGMDSHDLTPVIVAQGAPEVVTDEYFEAWAAALTPLAQELETRYAILGKLRSDLWMASLLASAGVTTSATVDEELKGVYDTYIRKLSKIYVPTLTAADITQDGLELRFAHRPGDSAAKWVKGLDALRSGFRNAGMDASRLHIVDAEDGAIRLVFDDAPINLPSAVAPPSVPAPHTLGDAISAYPKLRWRFGVDARGNEISARLEKQPHIAIIAETGGGKSVLAATLLEELRPYASCWIFDGKGSDHPKTLGDQAGISWISKTPQEHIVGIRWLWDEMNERYLEADQRKAAGSAGSAFAFPTIFVLIDELPSLRGRIAKVDPKDKGALFDFYVNDLLQKGRQARIHLCLVSQSLRVDAVPGWWQENLSQIVFLGTISSRSMISDAIPETVRDQVSAMSSRIPAEANGRGIYLARGEGGTKPIMFQSYWGYAPNTTSLDMAPTDEIREAWEAARETAASLPLLYDRVGIRVDSPEWRTAPMAELAETPTVVVADEHGLIDGMSIYDPLSMDFRGAVQIAVSSNRARGRGAVISAPHQARTDRAISALSTENSKSSPDTESAGNRAICAPTPGIPDEHTDDDGWTI